MYSHTHLGINLIVFHSVPSPKRRCHREELSSENLTQPSVGTTASKANSRSANSVTTVGCMYSHWFALALYNLSIQSNLCSISETTINSIAIKLPQTESLKHIVEVFRSVSKLPEEQRRGRGIMCCTLLQQTELTSTAILARELDRFLFSDADVALGACYHQLPTTCDKSGAPERADFYIAQLHQDHLPGSPVGIADFKVQSIHNAYIESVVYSTTVMQKKYETNTFVTQLVFPASKDVCKLQLHVGANGRIIVIDILEAYTMMKKDIEKFFSVFYAAVYYLVRFPIQSALPHILPTPNLSLRDALTYNKSQSAPCRVFLHEDCVYKLFDTEEESVNIHLLQTIIPAAKVIHLSDDGRFQCLQYPYLQGSSKMGHFIQFVDVLKQLHCIHALGYVHADIREINIVFSDNNKNAWIIDLDIAAKVGDRYPQNYNHQQIAERHKDAIAGNPREICHDCYALSLIMKKNQVDQQFVDRVGNCENLLEIAEHLKKHYTSQ